MRLALLYALLDQSDLIREEHLRSALALWDYCERSAYYVWSDRFVNRDLDRLCRAIEESGERGLTLTSVVHELFRGNKPKEEVHALISLGFYIPSAPTVAGIVLRRCRSLPLRGRPGRRLCAS
jgi:hypothetical protein